MFDVLAFPEEHLMLQNRHSVGMPSASNGQDLDKEAIKISCRAHAHCRVLLSTRCIAGTLPSSWGAVGSFPMLTNVTLANNNLSGSLPTSWGTNLHRIPHFNHLQWLSVLPGALHSVVPKIRPAQLLMLRHPGWQYESANTCKVSWTRRWQHRMEIVP